MRKLHKIIFSLSGILYIITGLFLLIVFSDYIIRNAVSLLTNGHIDPLSNDLDDKDNYIFDFIVFIFLLSSLTITIFHIFRFIFPNIGKRKIDIMPILSTPFDIVKYISTEDEILVLDILKELHPRAYKFEIARKTELSKMKVHRIVTRLEQRDIVEITKIGRNSQVRLKNWLT